LVLLGSRLDRRLRDPEEFTAVLDLPLLSVIPQTSALSASPVNPRMTFAETEAFQQLRANLRYFNVDDAIHSVIVISSVPREGKTTVATNLAAAAAEAGAKVLLIEADLRRPTLWRHLGIIDSGVNGHRPEHGLSTVLAGACSMAEATRTISLTKPDDKPTEFDLLQAGPLPPNPIDLMESHRMEEVLRDAENLYDLVVLDAAPPAFIAETIPLVKKVSGVIVVARSGVATRDGVKRLRDQLANLNAKVLGVAVNGVRRRDSGYGYGYVYGYHPDSTDGLSDGQSSSRLDRARHMFASKR
jgi:receptor protein-tyrosine kinase